MTAKLDKLNSNQGVISDSKLALNLSPKHLATEKKLKFNLKLTIWQLLTTIIQLIFFICLAITMVSIYAFETPEIILKSTVLIPDPRFCIDLNNLPKLDFHTRININIVNRNILWVPIHVTYLGSFHTDSPNDQIVYGEVYNQLLSPMSTLETVITSDIRFDILEPQMYSLVKIFDACGIFTREGGRAPLYLKIWSKTSIGYGVFAIPIREGIFNRVEIPCPVLEETLGQLVLGVLSRLLPNEEQYNNTINDLEMGENPPYIPM